MSTAAHQSANVFKTKSFVASVNAMLLEFIENNKPTGYVPLGPGFKTLDYSTAKDYLQYYRMVSKFEKPDSSSSKLRQSSTLDAMLAYDTNGLQDFNPACMALEPFMRLQLYSARRLFNEVISDYNFSYSDIQFSTGETYCSTGGDTSVYAKLSDLRHWTCTPECFDLAARLVYNTPGLKASAKQHFAKFRFAHKKMWQSFRGPMRERDRQKWAFEIFKSKLKVIVTFIGGARVTTVPKNNDTDRAIECECMLNMLCQRVIAAFIRRKISKHFLTHYSQYNGGVLKPGTLERSQEIHKKLIADLSNATIDLKNASNSVWMVVVRWFAKNTLFLRHLEETRSAHIETSDGFHYLNMLSPMGNGFTFEVMTLLLFCCTRVFDTCAMVYGDDIIVHVDVAQQVIQLLDLIGFKTNETKTFTDGRFRESCGGFTLDGEHILSYECHWAENPVDAVVLINKIGIMARTTATNFSESLRVLHGQMLRLVTDSSLLRPYERVIEETFARQGFWSTHDIACWFTDLADGVFMPKTKLDRIRKSDPAQRLAYQEACVDYADQILDIHQDPKSVFVYYRYEIEAIPYTDAEGAKLMPLDNVNTFWTYFYLASGRCSAPVYRRSRVIKRKVIMVYQ